MWPCLLHLIHGLLFPVIGLYPQRSGHTRMMDSEPGRCKRTDGRKWRCSKSVVPHQKYCDRHMYRGRRGSRKHCQPIECVSRSVSKISSVTSGVDNIIAISIRNDLDGGNCNEGKGSSFVNSDPRKITKRKNTVAKTNYLGFVSPGFGFSPNSVLHSDAGLFRNRYFDAWILHTRTSRKFVLD